MNTKQNRSPLGEVWMQLIDPKRLARLMVIQGVSQRELAKAAGWKSHGYLNRLLNDSKTTTLEPEAAVRIAHYLQVGTDDLFVARSSSDAVRSSQRGSAA